MTTNNSENNTSMENQMSSPYTNVEIDGGSHRSENDMVHNGEEDENHKSSTKQKLLRYTLILVLIGFIIFVIVDSQQEQHVKQATQAFLKWVEENPIAGIFSFIGVYVVATVLFIPGSLLTLGSGFVFANVFGLGLGLVFSTISVFVGASLGATAAFLLGRYLFQESIQDLAKRFQVFQAVDSALESQGLKIMILLRLSPIIPFNAINYILGVTSVSLRAYMLACFAMLPGTILYTFLGSSAGSIVESASSGGGNIILTITIIVLGIIFGVSSIVATTYYAKKELNKIIEAQNERDE